MSNLIIFCFQPVNNLNPVICKGFFLFLDTFTLENALNFDYSTARHSVTPIKDMIEKTN